MPKTIIIRQTWYCNVCRVGKNPGETDNQGGWQSGSATPTPCPRPGCTGMVTMETDPAKCGRLTVMGVEGIEPEIEERTEATHRARRIAEINQQADAMDADGGFATVRAKEKFIADRSEGVERSISGLKALPESPGDDPTYSSAGFFLKNALEVIAYRVRRQADIVRAIAEARLREIR